MSGYALIVFIFTVAVKSEDLLKWDHLSATYPRPFDMPMNEDDAIKEGWTLLADNCLDNSSPFLGKRYLLGGEHATILIFDVHGQIAGFQMAYKTELKTRPYGKYAEALVKYGSFSYLTAYFTEPSNICDKSIMRPKDIIGEKLILLMGSNRFMKVPRMEKDLANTKWILGHCKKLMGTHYFYDISRNMDCDDIFPIFILYNKEGQLYALGLLSDVYITGRGVEHLPTKLVPFSFQKRTRPLCLEKVEMRSTQHVYFTKLGLHSHGCV